jgi:hypothetical protein
MNDAVCLRSVVVGSVTDGHNDDVDLAMKFNVDEQSRRMQVRAMIDCGFIGENACDLVLHVRCLLPMMNRVDLQRWLLPATTQFKQAGGLLLNAIGRIPVLRLQFLGSRSKRWYVVRDVHVMEDLSSDALIGRMFLHRINSKIAFSDDGHAVLQTQHGDNIPMASADRVAVNPTDDDGADDDGCGSDDESTAQRHDRYSKRARAESPRIRTSDTERTDTDDDHKQQDAAAVENDAQVVADDVICSLTSADSVVLPAYGCRRVRLNCSEQYVRAITGSEHFFAPCNGKLIQRRMYAMQGPVQTRGVNDFSTVEVDVFNSCAYPQTVKRGTCFGNLVERKAFLSRVDALSALRIVHSDTKYTDLDCASVSSIETRQQDRDDPAYNER